MPSSALFTKMNLKDQSEIVVLNAPQSFETELEKKINKLAQGDAVVWFAYPKGTSKRYKCEINRDTGWTRALFLLTTLLSLFFVSCFGGHGGGGGGSSPVFQVTVSHTGNFQKGQQNATYTIAVTNVGTAASVGHVQVNITIPSGETLVSTS